MQLTVNGETMSFSDSVSTIEDALRVLGVHPEHVVVECNQTLCRGSFSQNLLKDGDVLEVVHFMGGGL